MYRMNDFQPYLTLFNLHFKFNHLTLNKTLPFFFFECVLTGIRICEDNGIVIARIECTAHIFLDTLSMFRI